MQVPEASGASVAHAMGCTFVQTEGGSLQRSAALALDILVSAMVHTS